MKLGIVIDSCVYLSEQEIEDNDIRQVSLNIMYKDEVVRELDVDPAYVFDRMGFGHKLTTTQPSPGEFLNTYEEMIEKGYDKIFVITLAKPLSGTFQSALLAKNMMDDSSKIHLFESKMAAFGNEMLTLELATMIKDNVSYEMITNRMNALMDNSELIFTIENLIHIAKSGRLSKAKALVGSVLRVKPLIKMDEGKLDMYHTERTHKKVIKAIINRIKETTLNAKQIHVRILSHASIEQARLLEKEVKEAFSNINITFSEYLGPIFCLHLGKSGYGISWCSE